MGEVRTDEETLMRGFWPGWQRLPIVPSLIWSGEVELREGGKLGGTVELELELELELEGAIGVIVATEQKSVCERGEVVSKLPVTIVDVLLWVNDKTVAESEK